MENVSDSVSPLKTRFLPQSFGGKALGGGGPREPRDALCALAPTASVRGARVDEGADCLLLLLQNQTLKVILGLN